MKDNSLLEARLIALDCLEHDLQKASTKSERASIQKNYDELYITTSSVGLRPLLEQFIRNVKIDGSFNPFSEASDRSQDIYEFRKRTDLSPPKSAINLLKVFGKSSDVMIGDLTEKYEEIAKSHGVRSARKYFWWHTVMSIGPIMLGRVIRLAVWLKAFVGGVAASVKAVFADTPSLPFPQAGEAYRK